MVYVLVGTNEQLVWGEEVRFDSDTDTQARKTIDDNPSWLGRYNIKKLYRNPKGNDFNLVGTWINGEATRKASEDDSYL